MKDSFLFAFYVIFLINVMVPAVLRFLTTLFTRVFMSPGVCRVGSL